MSVVPLPKAPQSASAALERRLAQVERQLAHLIAELPDAMGEVVGKATARALDTAKDEARALIRDEMATRGVVAYKGVWSDRADYVPGDLVTYGGGGWICRAVHTNQKPGGGNFCWQLAIKSG